VTCHEHQAGCVLKITANQVSIWAGILGIPPLAIWYADHFPGVHAKLPTWGPNTALSIFFILFVVMLVANAAIHTQFERYARSHEEPIAIATRPGDWPRLPNDEINHLATELREMGSLR
jgi:HAMP domain-containing protein